MPDDPVPGIVVAAPAVPVPSGPEPLEELAHTAALSRSDDVWRVNGVEHTAVEHIGHFAHLGFHPERHVLDVAVDAGCTGNLVIGIDHRPRALAGAMWPRPTTACLEPRHRHTAAAHSNRIEEIPPDRFFIRQMCDPGDHLARRVIRYVLIIPAGTRRTNRVQR